MFQYFQKVSELDYILKATDLALRYLWNGSWNEGYVHDLNVIQSTVFASFVHLTLLIPSLIMHPLPF